MENAENQVRRSLEEAQSALQALLANKETIKAIATAGDVLVKTFKQGGRVFSCGNGGSLCDAMHFAEELSARYRLDRPGLRQRPLVTRGISPAYRMIMGMSLFFPAILKRTRRRVIVCLPSAPAAKAKIFYSPLKRQRKLGVTVIGMMGKPDSPLGAVADIKIATPAGAFADHIQELHIKAIHIMIELVERQMFPQNYKD